MGREDRILRELLNELEGDKSSASGCVYHTFFWWVHGDDGFHEHRRIKELLTQRLDRVYISLDHHNQRTHLYSSVLPRIGRNDCSFRIQLSTSSAQAEIIGTTRAKPIFAFSIGSFRYTDYGRQCQILRCPTTRQIRSSNGKDIGLGICRPRMDRPAHHIKISL